MSGNVVHFGGKHGGLGEGRSIASENAARNILVPGGHRSTKNGQIGLHKTTAKVAATCEMLTHRGARAPLFLGL